MDDNVEEELFADRTEVEARTWLADHAYPDDYGAQRFAEPGAVKRFVDALYAAGAVHVSLWKLAAERVPTLMQVTLPQDAAARRHLFAILRDEEDEYGEDFAVSPDGRPRTLVTEEMARDMGDPAMVGHWLEEEGPLRDIGQDALTLWWD